MTATLIADLFNVTNTRTETAVDQTWTFGAPNPEENDPATCGGPRYGHAGELPGWNPNFGQPISFQQPFRARLGVRLSW